MCYHGNRIYTHHNGENRVPRNPSKARCAVPGCKSWSMRDHPHCRSHRDHELGPRRAGAPDGNLNALSERSGDPESAEGRHAGYSDGLPEPDLARLAAVAVGSKAEEDLPLQFGLALRTIQRRTKDPFLALLALDRVLDGLIDRVATQLLHRELSEALAPIPPLEREGLQNNIERLAARDSPRRALIVLRRLRGEREKKTKAMGTTAGTGATEPKNGPQIS
jgi:hypothetical protein